MAHILGLDPGTLATGWVIWDTRMKRLLSSAQEGTGSQAGATPNDVLLQWLRDPTKPGENFPRSPRAFDRIARTYIEEAVIYQACDRNLHDTILVYGRMIEAMENRGVTTRRFDRSTIKAHLCPGVKNPKDSSVIAALRDKFGEKGTAKNPGPLFGLKGHSWQALAVAIAGSEMESFVEKVKAKVVRAA